jgi:glutathione reductase (NADPH)
MSTHDFDLFVIGAGSGGVRAARTAASLGARVAIAEERYFGGTCVNVGCIPKKLLVYASHFAEDFKASESYGWASSKPQFRWRTLIENKDREIARLNGVYERTLSTAGVRILRGHAELAGPNAVQIDGATHSAAHVLIATGGWPWLPDIPGREHAITSNEAFHLDSLPERIAIVGGGYIAVEFAGIFHGLGVETTLLYRGPLFMRGFDDDVRETLAQELRRQGIALKFGASVSRIDQTARGFRATLSDGAVQEADLFMYATGRSPLTSGLGLERAGVRINSNGAIEVDDHYRTNVPSIHAIGDVTDRVKLTPVALAEGMIVARNLFGPGSEPIEYSLVPSAVFSQPNVGTVGLTEAQARARHADIAIYKARFTPLKATLTGSGEKTFMKMIVDRATDRVLGIHMVGDNAGEIIQGMAVALQAGATKAVFDRTIGIHPTAAEEFVTMRVPV